ncbi:MAG: glycosyltransferase, partial [Bacteroidota bacterium]
MKIAYLSTFYPFRGGIAQFNAALYREFEKKHEIIPFTFFRQYPAMLFPGKSQYVQEGDTADPVPSVKVLDTMNPIGYRRAANKINRFDPNMLITKYWMPYFAPSLGWVAKEAAKNNTINISILDNVLPHEKRPGDIQLTKFFLKHNHAFIVMSESVRDDLLSLKPDAHFRLVPHPLYTHFGVKPEKYPAREKLNIPVDKKVLLFFGFIRNYKGLDLAIEAIKDLPDDYLLVIAGESYGNYEKYRQMADSYGITHKVRQEIRYISDDEVPYFFGAADVCLLPYKSATQSGITGIAYHFDLPVIATDVGGLKETVKDMETGI